MSEPMAKRRKTKKGASAPTITDPRFANIHSDPRYRLPSRHQTQVKLDKRFSRILKDDDFARKARVDRYGRPFEAREERKKLRRRFEIDDEDEAHRKPVGDDEDVRREPQQAEKTRDLLREGLGSGSSSEEESLSEEEEENGEDDIQDTGLAEHLEGNVPLGEVSPRIAVVNVDWDNIRAEDLMAVFSSFLPTGGKLLKVAIYPSEFGKERLEREEFEGPPAEIFGDGRAAKDSTEPASGDESDDEERIKKSMLKPDRGEEFDSAKLRRYQLERLRYFYAILTFSSSSVARAIYDAIDGTEYLSSANFFDLRFVPDDTDFSLDKPREECESIPGGYKPNEFVTDALQHSKVKLTWDADDLSRKEAQARAFRGGRKEIDENNLRAYLGSDSSDEAEDAPAPSNGQQSTDMSKKEEQRQKMRELLGLPEEPVKSTKDDAPVGDLQITFSSGLSSQNDIKRSVFVNEPQIEETTLEKYVRKERERKQKRKEKLKQTLRDVAISEEQRQDDVPKEDLGFDDPFFAEPENDKVTRSKMRKEERMKKKAEQEVEERANASMRAELELLMADDEDPEVRHFDMNEIEKAEKRAKKRGKEGKRNKSQTGEKAFQDEFKMDIQDPRFARLYEHHEFAIDPTHPRFKGTAGMKALLDERRKRRANEESMNDRKLERGKDNGEKDNGEKRDERANPSNQVLKTLVDKVKKHENR